MKNNWDFTMKAMATIGNVHVITSNLLENMKKNTNVFCGYIGSRFLMIEKHTTGEAFEPLGGDQESGPKTAAANLPSRYLARHKKGGKFLAKKSH
jgi:hypothetical protein